MSWYFDLNQALTKTPPVPRSFVYVYKLWLYNSYFPFISLTKITHLKLPQLIVNPCFDKNYGSCLLHKVTSFTEIEFPFLAEFIAFKLKNALSLKETDTTVQPLKVIERDRKKYDQMIIGLAGISGFLK